MWKALLLACLVTPPAATPTPTPRTVPFPGQPDIRLEIHSPRNPGKLFLIALHEDEDLINADVIQPVQSDGGTFVILRQRGDRLLSLTLDGHRCCVDPNRLFTRMGAKRTLRKENRNDTECQTRQAVDRAEAVGEFIVEHLDRLAAGTIVVATHNNDDGYKWDGKGGSGDVSIELYRNKLNQGARWLSKVHLGAPDEDDLLFVTRKPDFRKLRKARFNVVLQHPRVATEPNLDDGSLSVYAEMRGVRYINIEAQLDANGAGHLDVQRTMLDRVYRLVAPVSQHR